MAAFLAGLAAAAFFFLAMDRSSEMKKLGEIPLPIVASPKIFRTHLCKQAELGLQTMNPEATFVDAPVSSDSHP
ncbi:MAG: hypothetical protein K8U03_08235 [Planctomycetia bacterium]|nr:hypothetical protein [Planctomycetia bacterium]